MYPSAQALTRFAALLTLLAPLALLPPQVRAEELNCRVTVDYTQLSGSKYTYLDEMARVATEYLNNHSWTSDRFQRQERIECSVQIVFEEAVTLTSFRTRLILTSVRPIYGTIQSTRVLQINDAEWQFEFAQGTPLVFDIERFDPLTSVLDFYVYLMLGYDYDTFGELGGTDHFQKARRIAELAQSQNALGWSQVGSDRSRTALITQILDPRFVPLRRAYFTYHFKGLDHFITETQNARLAVMEVLRALDALYQDVSRNYAIDVFFGTKYQELAAIFESSPMSGEAYAMLTEIDPSHLTEYNRLVQ